MKMSDKPLLGVETFTLTKNGVKIGFVGVGDLEWFDYVNKFHLGLKAVYEDYVECCDRLVPKLSEDNCELVIVLSHMRAVDDERLARSVSAPVDMVLGGHDHMSRGNMEGKTALIKSGSDFREITQIEVVHSEPKTGWSVGHGGFNYRWEKHSISPALTPNPEIAKIVESYVA
jgi:2',3'-cyclic-nucleotide 2'-phosphodiesterase (5'-nucleotidase family)